MRCWRYRCRRWYAISVYGADVTAAKAVNKFPDQNPNPVLRATQDGRLAYANPASELILRRLGVRVGEALPADFVDEIQRALAPGASNVMELESEGRTYELLVVSVYEYDFINLYGTDVTAARQVEWAKGEIERLLLNILGGLTPHSEDHVRRVASMGQEMIAACAALTGLPGVDDGAVQIRVGMHTGPGIGGVIGIKKFIYDVWGDAVNTASRMESHGVPGRIQVTEAAYERLRDVYRFEPRGVIDVKGKGLMQTYLLLGPGEVAEEARSRVALSPR